MSALVSCSDLLVLQIETDVYSMLRKVVHCSADFISVFNSVNWNHLPYDIRACDSVNVFKRKLKAHLFDIAYTT